MRFIIKSTDLQFLLTGSNSSEIAEIIDYSHYHNMATAAENYPLKYTNVTQIPNQAK